MAVAGVIVQVYHGASGAPTLASVEAPTVMHFNRQDSEGIGFPVPAPTGGVKSTYSNYKALRFTVSVAGTTTLSNLRIALASAPATGLRAFALTAAPAAYTQCTGLGATAGNRPADSSAALAETPHPDTPANYSVIPTSPTFYVFDTASYPASGVGPFGKFAQVLAGVSDQYAGGAGNNRPLPNFILSYDEA